MPEIQYFYKNIAAIIRGEWWLFAEPQTMEDYTGSVALIDFLACDISDACEDDYDWQCGRTHLHDQRTVCIALCYDLEEAARHLNYQKIDSVAIEAVFHSASGFTQNRKEIGLVMPASVFIESTICEEQHENVPRDLATTIRNDTKWSLFKEFRDLHQSRKE